MKHASIQRRREILELEIATAKDLLSTNMDNLELTSYLLPQNSVAPLSNSIIGNPMEALNGIDQASRFLLSDDNTIRKIIKYLNMLIKGINTMQT